MSTKACTEAALTANAKLFAMHGRIVATKAGSIISFLFGLAVLAFLAGGVGKVDYEDDLEKLWIEEGSRAEDENKIVDEIFGGTSGLAQILIHLKDGPETPADANDHGILSAEHVGNFINITKPLLLDTGEVKLTKRFTVGGVPNTEVDLDILDFCDRPPVPNALLPFTVVSTYNDPNQVGVWLTTGAAASGSVSYISQCLGQDKMATMLRTKNSTTVTDAEYVELQYWYLIYGGDMDTLLDADTVTKEATITARPGLANGFGFTKFPCTRSMIADCWSDGNFDSPAELLAFQEYSFSHQVLKDTTGAFAAIGATSYSDCQTEMLSVVFATAEGGALAGGATAVQAAAAGTNAQTQVAGALSIGEFFYGAGHWYRPSMASQTSSFADDFITSLSNTLNSDIDKCVEAGLLRQSDGFLKSGLRYSAIGSSAFHPSLAASVPGGCCFNWGGPKVTALLYVGGVVPHNFGDSSYSTTNRFAYTTRVSMNFEPERSVFLKRRLMSDHNIDALTDDEVADLRADWDKVWIDALEPMQSHEEGAGFADGEQYGAYQMNFIVDRSFSDFLQDAAKVESTLLIAGYITLVVFSLANFIIFKCPPTKEGFVYSSSGACFCGVVVIGLATASGFGFFGWVGQTVSPINAMLVPFLAVGLGLDDVFVILTEYTRHAHHQDATQTRIVLTMADAGSSVTVTSVANMVAFLMPAAFIRLPAVYTFGYQMGAAVFMNWFALIFMFVPMLFWDAIRVSKKKSLCCPTFEVEETEEDTRNSVKKYSLTTFIENHLAPLYKNKIFKGVSLVIWLGMTIFLGVWGFEKVEKGLVLSDVVIDGHYVRGFVKMQEQFYPLLPGSVVQAQADYTVDGVHYNTSTFQNHVLAFLNDTADRSPFLDQVNSPNKVSGGHWLKGLIDFYSTTLGNPLEADGTIPITAFYSTLQTYLASSGASKSSSIVCKNADGTFADSCASADDVNIKIFGSRAAAYFVNIDNDEDYVKAIENIRDLTDDSGAVRMQCCNSNNNGSRFEDPQFFYSGSLFRYWQQYVGIEETTVMAVGFSLLGVFVATLLFQWNPLSSLIVGIMLLAIVLQLYGFMAIMAIKLNGFSVLNLAVAVGMGVELTAHYSYAFLRANAKSDDPDTRMEISLIEMLPPMLAGSMTTFISVICLAFAKYAFFSLYYFQMISMMILLSFLNGMWFLPLILSLVNPTGIDKDHRNQSLQGSVSPSDEAKMVDDGM